MRVAAASIGLHPYTAKRENADTGSNAPGIGIPRNGLYWSARVLPLPKYLIQYSSYSTISVKDAMSQIVHSDHAWMLKSENIRTMQETDISPILSRITSILFSPEGS